MAGSEVAFSESPWTDILPFTSFPNLKIPQLELGLCGHIIQVFPNIQSVSPMNVPAVQKTVAGEGLMHSFL